jgi:ribose transport system permease protein
MSDPSNATPIAEATSERSSRPSGRAFTRAVFSEYFVLVLAVLFLLALAPFTPVILSPGNLGNVLSNIFPLLVVAIGQTFVLIVAGIDLSQPSIIGVSSVVGAAVMAGALNPTQLEASPLWGSVISEKGGLLGSSALGVPVAVIAMLATGTLIGLFNGFSITRLQMPPFMVTLATQIFFAAFAIFLTKSENINNLPASFVTLGKGDLGFVPIPLLIALMVATLAQLTLSRTVLGRHLYATGSNAKAALVSGVPTDRAIIAAYAISGFCASMGAVLYSARLEVGQPTLGANILLDVIGATVIGGTSLFGGKGRVLWTLYGVLFFVLLDNGLNLLSLSFFTVTIVKGAVILMAALLDVARARWLSRNT